MLNVMPSNWTQFQHYKDRSPPWIKLHRTLLDSMDYGLLTAEAGKALPLIWLLASENDGLLPDVDKIAFRLRTSAESAQRVIEDLVNRGFLVPCSAEQPATPAQKSNPSRHIPDAVKQAVYARDAGACVWCGSLEYLEYDHITPVSKGGLPVLTNVQLLCRSCNRKKRVSGSVQAEQKRAEVLRRRSLEGEGEAKSEQRGEKKEPVRSPTGSRLPADWCLPDDWRSWAERERPDLNVQREADSFADYWHGVAGAKGRKADWEATWRNWVRRADGRQRGATQNIPQPGKRMQAIMRLEAMKNGLGNAGNHHGDSEALMLGPGPGAGGGAGRGNGSGMG